MTIVQDADGRDLMQSTASVDAEAAGTVEYSISGADSGLFEINEATGKMCFKQSPDYENPLDSDGDNVYEVTLERTVNGVTSTQTVEIAICDKVAENSTTPTATATGNVLENDTDPNGDDLTASLVTGPQNGSVALASNGDYEYTPNPGFTGIDVFTYEVSDGNGGTDTTEVCIEVVPEGTPEPEPPPAPANNAPDAVNDSTRTNVDVSVSGTVADNDTDLDGDTLTFSIKEPALNGAVALAEDGSYTYTPNAGFVGFDTFRYEVSDGNGGTDIAIVLVEIEPELVVDPPPVVEPPVVEPPVVEPPVQSLNLQSLNLQSLNLQSLNLQSLNLQLLNHQLLNHQSLNHQSLNHQSLNLRPIKILMRWMTMLTPLMARQSAATSSRTTWTQTATACPSL